ncbi:efflux RND transporter permease subunit [Methanococcus maripaludis]|uniref:MMPL family transporter n=1 Tax=Methanococcus maripaludis TaxID=39152 RepID=A0A8T3VVK8_METMI|nr:MMPL family transporter [Methanococcus maripaludis]MBG0768616.1 MMPL family transporter [Methanococcus maripaludis]
MKAEKILQKIAEASERHPLKVVAVVIVLTIFMAFLATGVESQTDYEKMVPQDDPVIVALNEIRDEFGGTETVMFGVKLVPSDSSEKVTDIRDPRVLELVDFLEQDIGSMDMVTSVSSRVDVLKAYNNDVIPNDIATVKTIYQNLPESSQDGMFNNDYSMVVVYATTDAGTEDKNILVKDINSRLDEAPIPPGVEVITTGTPALNELLERMMDESQAVTGLASLLAIFTILLLYFRNIVKSVLPLIPVVVAVIWAAGSMAIFKIPMDTATSVMGSLLLGLGIDYGVHLFHRYEEELGDGKSMEEAINIAVVSTGSAVLVTTATTMAGFAALTIAPLSMMANMGKVCTLGIFFCMAAVICLLPPLIVIEERYTRPFLKKLTLKLKGESNE